MGQVTITIDKREYAITCEDGQEAHIIKLSRILDERARQIAASIGMVNENMKLAMVGLTLADELMDVKNSSATITPEALSQIDNQIASDVNVQTAKITDLIHEIKAL